MIDYTKKGALIVTTTPQLVEFLLSLNTHNRKLKSSNVDLLSSEIKAGRWKLTNQGIGITKDGRLVDGQHRLEAIKKAGFLPVEIVVVTGLDDGAQAVVDKHSKRSQADVIKLLMNRSVSSQMVAAANVMLRVRSGQSGFYMDTSLASDFAVADLVAEHSDAFDLIMPAVGSKTRAGVCAALVEYGIRYDVDAAVEFAEKIKTGLSLGANDPAYRLRRWIEHYSKANGGKQQADSYGATVTACIADARGESLSLLRISGSWDRLPKYVRKWVK